MSTQALLSRNEDQELYLATQLVYDSLLLLLLLIQRSPGATNLYAKCCH